MIQNQPAFQNTMSQLGRSFVANENLLTAGEAAICSLYGSKQDHDVNKVRYAMFGSKTTDPSKLPPCQDACQKHIKRANYQAAIWQRCLEPRPTVPSPHGHGWNVCRAEGNLPESISVHWMDLPAAPQAVLQCISCKCRTCSGGRCTCKLNQLPCTGACSCDDGVCENRQNIDTDMGDDQLLSEDDSDDIE